MKKKYGLGKSETSQKISRKMPNFFLQWMMINDQTLVIGQKESVNLKTQQNANLFIVYDVRENHYQICHVFWSLHPIIRIVKLIIGGEFVFDEVIKPLIWGNYRKFKWKQKDKKHFTICFGFLRNKTLSVFAQSLILTVIFYRNQNVRSML